MMNKNSKRIMTLVIAIAMVAAMAACGNSNNSSSSSVPTPPPASNSPSSLPEATPPVDEGMQYDSTAQMYSGAITGARSKDENDAFGIFTHDTEFNMSSYRNNYADMKKEDGSAYSEEEMLEGHNSTQDMTLQLVGINKADVESYAISVSPMNTKAYGIAVIKPVAGKEAAVKTALETYVTNQQKSFENYLPDQLEIAKAGSVKVMDDGTVVMVVSEGQDTIYDTITKGLMNNSNANSGSTTSSTTTK